MSAVRRLLHEAGTLPDSERHAFRDAARRVAATGHGAPPWRLRAEGLQRLLTPDEWAVVIGHLIGHRAYSSNAKQNRNASDASEKNDLGKVREALRANDEVFTSALQRAEVTTVGEWLSKNDRQRNRSGDYRFTIKREWVAQEAQTLFSRQRTRKNPAATEALEKRIIHEIVHQEPIRSKPVGKCTFKRQEDRAAKHSYSFELFRLVKRLNDLKIVSDMGELPARLMPDQIALVLRDLGIEGQITYQKVRKKLGLEASKRFDGVPDRAAERTDIFNRKKGDTNPGTSALRAMVLANCGTTAWLALLADRGRLDGIAAALAHHEDLEEIERSLSALGLDERLLAALLKEADGGELGFFKGTGHLSLQALRDLEPHLLAGRNLHESLGELAKTDADYDPSRDRFSRKPGISGHGPRAVRAWLSTPQLETLVTSQTSARAIRETFRQVLEVLRAYSRSDSIHLEMAREVGKNPDARKEIEDDQKRRANQRADLRKQFADTFGRASTESEAERWELLKQQLCKCPFTPRAESHQSASYPAAAK